MVEVPKGHLSHLEVSQAGSTKQYMLTNYDNMTLLVDCGFVGALQHLILWQNTHVTSNI